MMKKKLVSEMLLAIVIAGFLALTCDIQSVKSETLTIVCVEPSTSEGYLGNHVTIYITVKNVVRLWAYQFNLTWSPDVVEVENKSMIVEGDFLKRGGSHQTSPAVNFNKTAGYVFIGNMLLTHQSPPVSGSGTLYSITFHMKVLGACPLHLSNTRLLDDTLAPISHITEDGYIQVIEVVPTTIIVPENYPTIQEAIDAASEGDTILVRAGTYVEHLTVNKTLTIIGENPDTTIIDGVTNAETIFYVTADNVNITGFTMKAGDYGIWLHECSGCSVSNNILLNIYFHWGIYLDNSTNNVVTKNTVKPGHMAIYSSYSTNNIISFNYIVYNRVGIILVYSSGNMIRDNIFVENEEVAVFLLDSGGNILRNNTLTGNYWGFHIWGDQLLHYINDIDNSNTVEGKPVYYWVNESGKQVPLDAGYVGLINCSNIIARNLNIAHSGEGILLAYTNSSIIEGLNATSYIYYGINAPSSHYNIICNNNLTKCRGAGIFLNGSTHNLLKRNTIEYGSDGLAMTDSSNNTVIENSISYNTAGVILGNSSNNTICRNNIIGNGVQTSVSTSSINIWDDGLEGNYWRHFFANDTDRDGIEDDAYAIDENNADNFPLMGTFHSFNTSLDSYINVISNSTVQNVEYFNSNNTIRLRVSGTTGRGFCRVCVPHALIDPSTINVIVDDGQTPLLYHNYSICDNGTYRWIYFEYQHSDHEIIIVPEFSSFLILSLFMTATPLAVIIYKRKHPV